MGELIIPKNVESKQDSKFPDLVNKSVKDMKTVRDYENKRKLEIFRGQCFNNASTSLSNIIWDVDNVNAVKQIFDLAQELYDEGLRRDWLRLKEDA